MNSNKKIEKIYNYIVVAYVMAVVLYQVYFKVTPVQVFLTQTGLDIISQGLAMGGLLLFIGDLFITRYSTKGYLSKFLVGIIGALILSSLLYMSYGWTNNAKIIIWQINQMLIIYPVYQRLSQVQWNKVLHGLYFGVILVILPSAVISIMQFIMSLSYTTLSDGFDIKQGFQEGRLFGIFTSIYFSSIMITVLLIATIYYFSKTKRKSMKIFYGFSAVVFYFYFVLTATRSVQVGVMAAIVIFGSAVLSKRLDRKFKKKAALCVVSFIIAVVAAGGFYVVNNATDYLLKKIPVAYMNSDLSDKFNNDTLIHHNLELNRTDVKMADISNHRVVIWSNYLQITGSRVKSILFGMSPGNAMSFIKDNYPDKFIVTYIKKAYPEMYAKNLTYDTHNSYLSIFTATGLLGVILLGSFGVTYFRKLLRTLWNNKNLDSSTLTLMIIMVVILASAFFDSDLFFKCTSTSVTLWLIAGMLAKKLTGSEGR